MWVPIINNLNGKMEHTLVIIDRNQGGKENLKQVGVTSHALATVNKDLFKEALVYPTKDYKALLILGVLFLIANLSSVFVAWQIDLNGGILAILGIISILLYFVTEGYILSVIKEALNNGDDIPALDIVTNFVDGLKLLVVQIVYYIIPTIIVLIVGWLSGTYSAVFKIVEYVGEDVANTTVNATTMVNTVPQEYWSALFTGLLITCIVAIILYIIFGLLLEIAMCRLAKYDSIGEAINFKEIIGDIKEIGVGRYIGWYVILLIIAIVLGFILGLITAIPYIGVLIAFLVGAPFIALFGSRALGKLYSDAE
jgi:hypothetical protein